MRVMLIAFLALAAAAVAADVALDALDFSTAGTTAGPAVRID